MTFFQMYFITIKSASYYTTKIYRRTFAITDTTSVRNGGKLKQVKEESIIQFCFIWTRIYGWTIFVGWQSNYLLSTTVYLAWLCFLSMLTIDDFSFVCKQGWIIPFCSYNKHNTSCSNENISTKLMILQWKKQWFLLFISILFLDAFSKKKFCNALTTYWVWVFADVLLHMFYIMERKPCKTY